VADLWKPFWHPLSTILIADPPCFATESLLKILLAAGNPVRVMYGGDRMWPAVEQGSSFDILAADPTALRRGDPVVACPEGIPDLLRIDRRDGERILLAADADEGPAVSVAPEALVARAALERRRVSRPGRRLRRALLELTEAWGRRPDPAADPAATVLDKYDAQAPFYARVEGPDLERALLERIARVVPAGGRILVVGSGTGRESFALAQAGWKVLGVDFAPAMVASAASEAARRGLEVDFRARDVRDLELEPGSLDAVLFTYDVYSFIPEASQRLRTLSRLRSWLRPDGVVFLSARRAGSVYERAILSVQWLARRPLDPGEWGRSHSRWVAGDGSLRRSFVHVFTERRLAAEILASGFVAGESGGGHVLLRRR
jgi:SAM-dependent methyltransferase